MDAISWITIAVIAAAYGATMHRSIAGGDAGELMCVAHELGVAHPPGYPTFTMLTKLGETVLHDVLGLGSAASCQNATHTFFSVLAAAVLFFAARRFALSDGGTTDPLVASLGSAAAALLFAFAPNVWAYATSTEVFPLNNLLTAVLLLCVVRHAEVAKAFAHDRSPALATKLRCSVYVSAFLSGVALTNQHTTVVFIAPFALWAAATVWLLDPNMTPRRFWAQVVPVSALCIIAGLLPYVYVVVAAEYNPSTNSWGATNTLAGFWKHLTREEYGTFSLASKEATYRASNFARSWAYFLHDISQQTVWIGWALAVPPVFELVRAYVKSSSRASSQHRRTAKGPSAAKKPDTTATTLTSARVADAKAAASSTWWIRAELPLVVAWFVYANFFNYLSNLPIDQPLFYGVQQRFWLQPLLPLALLVGKGVAQCSEMLGKQRSRQFAWTAVMVGVVQLVVHVDQRNESGSRYVEDFGRLILAPLPHGALLLTKGDLMINSARAVQTLYHYREDVTILDQELLTYPWYNELAARSPRTRDVALPGQHYFPNRPDTFDMRMLLQHNMDFEAHGERAPNDADLKRSNHGSSRWDVEADRTRRRVFVAVGWKEGDHSMLQAFVKQQFGLSEEVMPMATKKRMHAAPLTDASLLPALAKMSAELQRAIPDHYVRRRESSIWDVFPLGLGSSRSGQRQAVETPTPDTVDGRGTPHASRQDSVTGTFVLPPMNRYDAAAWESVVAKDLCSSAISTAFEMMTIAERAYDAIAATEYQNGDVGAERRKAHLAWVARGGHSTASCLEDDVHSSPGRTILCGLVKADRVFGELASTFTDADIPTYVLRNRGVALQAWLRFDEGNVTLMRKLRDTLVMHIADVNRRGSAEARKDLASIQAVAEHYTAMLNS